MNKNGMSRALLVVAVVLLALPTAAIAKDPPPDGRLKGAPPDGYLVAEITEEGIVGLKGLDPYKHWGVIWITKLNDGKRCRDRRIGPERANRGCTNVATVSNFWDVIQCAGAIGALVTLNGFVVPAVAYRIKKAGGIYKAAKKLVKAKNRQRRWNAAAALFGEVTSIGAVVEKCG